MIHKYLILIKRPNSETLWGFVMGETEPSWPPSLRPLYRVVLAPPTALRPVFPPGIVLLPRPVSLLQGTLPGFSRLQPPSYCPPIYSWFRNPLETDGPLRATVLLSVDPASQRSPLLGLVHWAGLRKAGWPDIIPRSPKPQQVCSMHGIPLSETTSQLKQGRLESDAGSASLLRSPGASGL